MKRMIALAALALTLPAWAEDEPVTPNSIVAAAPAADWAAIDPADLLVMDLAPDRDGNPRRVVIQLIPAPFSQGWVGNIRTLAKAHWWDGTSINRVQDNYVVQWGDVTEKKALPDGLRVVPESEYVATTTPRNLCDRDVCMRTPSPVDAWFQYISDDNYAGSYSIGFGSGWPLAFNGGRYASNDKAWPIHCYGMVGVGRNVSPDTGTGAELYTVIGHAPRQLDRNIALVGRIIEGMENLSSLPRGKGELSFYTDEESEKRVPILSVRLATQLPDDERPHFEYRAADNERFAAWIKVRENRQPPFFAVPSGGADICNAQAPVRRVQ